MTINILKNKVSFILQVHTWSSSRNTRWLEEKTAFQEYPMVLCFNSRRN